MLIYTPTLMTNNFMTRMWILELLNSGYFIILGDPGATSRDDVIFSARKFTSRAEEPLGFYSTDQFRSQLKSLSVIGQKNIFVPNQSPALFVLLFVLLIRRCSPTNCLLACSPYLFALCRRVSLDREVPLKGEP